jgi:hypothetical protein
MEQQIHSCTTAGGVGIANSTLGEGLGAEEDLNQAAS